MAVTWNGAVFSSNQYEVRGRVSVGEDGSGARFVQTGANKAYQDYHGLKAAAGAIKFGADLAQALDDLGDDQ